MNLQPLDFTLERSFARKVFFQQAEPFLDNGQGGIDTAGVRRAFDKVFGDAAVGIRQIVDEAGGSEADFEAAFEIFRQSVEAAFRPLQ